MTLRVGITQRVQEHATYRERRDCLDQRWMPFFERLSFLPIPLLNLHTDPARYLSALPLDALILSGGNDIGPGGDAPERDTFERAALEHAERHGMPVIGVCRGMQFMQYFCGGALHQRLDHAGIRHALHTVPVWHARLPAEVNSYHHFAIDAGDTADGFEAIAFAPDGSVEAMVNVRRRWLGIMWHPERETPSAATDVALFSDWLSEGTSRCER
jgi:putative glutamine amidotransferase